MRAIRQSLARLPEGLNDTYAGILQRVRREDVGILRKALLWVAFAVLPLTLDELHEAVAVDADTDTLEAVRECRLTHPRDILSIGSSLLSVSGAGYIRLAHLSVKDYLLSDELKNNLALSMFYLTPEEANHELATDCITYLTLDTFASGPVEKAEDWEARLWNHPLLKHASKSWSYYFRAAKPTTELTVLVSDFFSASSTETFMSWIQVLNSNWIFNWNDYPRHATPLYYAASFGLSDLVKNLLKNGDDVNTPGSRFGGTPLHGATLREHISIMKLLLESGADASKADFNCITPLHTAARVGNPEVIKLLMQYRASSSATDKLGKTPCDWAVDAKQPISEKLLTGEVYEDSGYIPEDVESPVYQRVPALFPALAVAQGISLTSSMARL